MTIHTYFLTVSSNHIDSFGHVNNAAYLEILEEARWDLITGNGYGKEMIQKTGLGPVILEINIRFIRELTQGEKIRIDTKLTAMKSKISKLKQEIFTEQGVLAAEAEFTFGLFDLKSRKLVLPTEEWKKGIGVK